MKSLLLRYKKTLLILLFILLLLALLPYGLKYGIVYTLQKQGFNNVSMENLKLNVFKGTLQVNQLVAKQDEVEKLHLGQLNFDYQWQSLFSKGMTAELITLSDLRLNIVLSKSGELEIVIPITSDPNAKEGENEEEAFSLPNLDVELFKLNNIQLGIRLPEYENDFFIEQLELSQVSTWNDKQAQLAFDAKLGEGHIEMDLSAQPLASTPHVKGNIKIRGLDISQFSGFLPASINRLQAKLATNLDIDVKGIRSEQLDLAVKGNISLVNSQLSLAKIDLKLAKAVNNVSLNANYKNGQLSLLAKGRGEYSDTSVNSDLLNLVQPTLTNNFNLQLKQQKGRLSMVSDGDFDLSNTQLNHQQWQWLQAKLSNTFNLTVEQNNDLFEIKAKGGFKLNDADVTFGQSRLLQAQLDNNFEIKAKWQNTQWDILAEGDLKLTDSKFTQGPVTLLTQLDNTFSVAANQQNDQLSFEASGDLKANNVDAQFGPLQLLLGQLDNRFKIRGNQNQQALDFNYKAEKTLTNLSLSDKQQDYPLFGAQNINITDFELNQMLALSLSKITMQDVDLGYLEEFKKSQLTAPLVTVNKLEYIHNDNMLEVGDVKINGLAVQMHIDQESKLLGTDRYQKTLAALQATTKKNDEQEKAKQQDSQIVQNKNLEQQQSPEFKVRLQQLLIAQNSLIHLKQEHKPYPIEQNLLIDNLDLGPVYSNEPEAYSNVLLNARLDQFSNIEVSAKAQLFKSPLNLEAKGRLDGVSLAQLSAFAEPVIGYEFTSGQLDHKFDLKLNNNNLDMKNKLKIRRVKLNNTPVKVQGNNSSPLPLPMAISMLEDSKGLIELDVPIKSNLNKTDVGLASIIRTSLSAVLQKSSLSFLKYYLQPYGAVLFAGEILLEQASSVRFEPMAFTPNSADLSEQHQEYADKLAELLQKRKQLQIQLCGMTNEQDKMAISEPEATNSDEKNQDKVDEKKTKTSFTPEQVARKLDVLAEERANNVKRYLLDKGIKGKRLFICKPKFKAKGLAGVELSM
ncbi:DUF748 domain-containing protein [Thalassotalea aquiviva]|uniref:DUF748 domain-containing protein n=1 Tax=Thalassotalea aquiviva TaxID=3242415 RepID=UPI00352B8355